MKNSNDLVSWSSKFACGIKIIDEQHKGLVMLVNDMFNHVTGNYAQEYNYFNKVIKEAVSYIKIHFATEEKIMLATNFDGYVEHKKKHELFVGNVVNNIYNFRFDKSYSLHSFTKFLKDWILTHIAENDKKYFDYLRKMATRKADGKLSISLEDVHRKDVHRKDVNLREAKCA